MTITLTKKHLPTYHPNNQHAPDSTFYLKSTKTAATPPGRPIVSANGHPTEHISEYVSNILNPLVSKLPSYIKDTTHFLNKLDSISTLPNDSLLVTLDVSSLYTNIPHTEGIQAARLHLDERTSKTPPHRNCLRSHQHYTDK